jgi:mannose-1-phosphate guanylyltransferase
MDMWAVVFAGGIGTRFWPLSSKKRPKPVLHLLGERPLIADVIHRLAPLVAMERVLVLTAHDIADAVQAAVPDVPAKNVLVEPRPMGTAAAFAWALEVIRARGGATNLVCALHADIAAAFPDLFRRGIERAAAVALQERAVVTLGVVPTRPETSFGYMVPGDPLDPSVPVRVGGACRVTRFVEKPGLDRVTDLLTIGALWHAGVIVGTFVDLDNELMAHAKELAPGQIALASRDLESFAEAVPSISIERALLERSQNIAVVPIDCGWDDVGTWACLRRARDLDDEGNGGIGDTHFVDSTGNVVHSEAGSVVLFGCHQMLVVNLNGITFITPLDKAADLRPLLEQLPHRLRTDPTRPPT